jgi:hypothetical protein
VTFAGCKNDIAAGVRGILENMRVYKGFVDLSILYFTVAVDVLLTGRCTSRRRHGHFLKFTRFIVYNRFQNCVQERKSNRTFSHLFIKKPLKIFPIILVIVASFTI